MDAGLVEGNAMADPGSPPTSDRLQRKGLKSSPSEASWKLLLRSKLERRVLDERSRILQMTRGRKRGTSVSGIISDMLAEEDAWIRDKQALGVPLQILMNQSTDVVAASSLEYCYHVDTDVDDTDEGLTEDERLELLLFLEETWYRAARDDELQQEARDEYEAIEAAEDAELADLVVAAQEEYAPSSGAHHTANAQTIFPVSGRLHLQPASELSPATELVSSRVVIGDEDMALPLSHASDARPSDVLCPVCQRLHLFDVSGVIYCRCGFRMDTANGLSLRHLQEQLVHSYAFHASKCTHSPIYVVKQQFGLRALYLDCAQCGDLQLIV